MIFLKKSQTNIWIPQHTKADGPYRLTISHNLTNTEHEFGSLQNEGYKSGYWIFMNLDFRYLESGENEYKLYDKDGNLIENGLLQVMQQLSEPISVSYEKKQNTIVYNG